MAKVPSLAKDFAGHRRIVEWTSGYVCERGWVLQQPARPSADRKSQVHFSNWVESSVNHARKPLWPKGRAERTWL